MRSTVRVNSINNFEGKVLIPLVSYTIYLEQTFLISLNWSSLQKERTNLIKDFLIS